MKTRLHACCSPQQAADLYRAFILDSAEILHRCDAEAKVVAHDPPEAAAQVRALLPGGAFDFMPQPDGDLGNRMAGMLQYAVAAGASRAVIIGSDSPSLPAAYVDDALAVLESTDLVLGPSTDGGYYLVGARLQSIGAPDIFAGIDWSTGDVLAQTLDRVEALAGSLSLALLPIWYDVDTPADAALLRVHLRALRRGGVDAAGHSLKVLEALSLPSPS